MVSEANCRMLRRQFEKERRIQARQNRAHIMALAKGLIKAISIGLFAYITMVTEQVAGWIAIPIISWSLFYGACAINKYVNWRWAPWQR